MGALAFWKAVVADRSNFLERIVALLEANRVRYCVIGGVAVNAYAEPMVTQDLDIVVVAEDLTRTRDLLEREFRVREFEHSVNVYDPGSKLQVQLQLGQEFERYPERAAVREVMELRLPIAEPRDLLASKVSAARDATRRTSKHLKDLADIARLVEVFPELEADLPEEIRAAIRRRT